MTKKGISAVFLAVTFMLCAVPAAFSDNMYSALDGFTITLDNAAYSIEVINEENGGRETAFEIVTPGRGHGVRLCLLQRQFIDRGPEGLHHTRDTGAV